MSRSKAPKPTLVQQPTPPEQGDDEVESDVEYGQEGGRLKDVTELELDRLVFGDSAGFRAELGDIELQEGVEQGADEDTGLGGLDDADLFFTDTGDADVIQPNTHKDLDDDDTFRSKLPAAWEDSDDERTLVSLASVPRLRKLRRTEAEDVVNGKDYSRRLRQQFELLHPRPQWAQDAIQKPTHKKRRLSGSDDDEASDEDMESDDVPSSAPLSKLLRDAESLVRSSGPATGKKRKLRPEVIDIQRTKDIAGGQPSAITSLSFHPTLPLLLSSGPSSTLSLHHIASSPPALTPNPLLTSLHIRGSALTTTAFHPKDSRIFLSARRRYFHVWDLQTGRVEKIARVYGQQHEQRSMERFKLSPDGKYMALLGSARKGGGVVNVLSASTLQWVTQVRIESRGGVADFCWWRDGKGLCIAGKSGEVTEWNVATQTVVARWQDEGAVGTTTIALGGQHEFVKSAFGTDRWVVVGSSSGIVNIYDRRVWLTGLPAAPTPTAPSSTTTTTGVTIGVPLHPKPTKTLAHLTTPTSHLVFSPDGQLLVMASKWKRDALRLVHLPSCTVFRNWPTSSTPLGRITGVAVAGGVIVDSGEVGSGTGSGVHAVLVVATEGGKMKMWEVR
ncbi:U3 snoRNP protein [Friedmanniomyces endolithicus]|uniref:U3 snoRNP protein n=1 Tax=Friedmanniomyces endolithicus TaxID=329885 RepID=A0AAN6L4B7_9PEZI|nr:U3 snoRNP protein [Friedmanniomyces endolithicus]KAK0299995.1 U3 snoRNP protein [Friedmanniomyces endolithicus]KAK0321167.1 U3 snoRNP protein [Friedmanniomyces endolithicus]KAK0922925.1 U3 snoRNP protein [Friedmanniomyces endolithicus]KAK1011417.1 U3 snoRNP protein [Friedmanniomyces endolithicus]